MIRWFIVIAITLALSGCTLAKIREDTPRFDGDFRGNNSAFARCIVSQLENHKKLLIRAMDYEVRSYPDIETVELTGTQVTTTIIAEHFRLTLRQESPESVGAEIVGWGEDTSALVWEYLELCANQT